jgi:DNA-binding transcriptional ArsR family regulator
MGEVPRTSAPPLLPVFRSRLVGELLALLTADPTRRWTLDELARRTHAPYQTVSHEVRRLEEAGLLAVEVIGRSKLIRIDDLNPNFGALAELATRTFGPPLVVAEEFGSIRGVDQLIIYGSWARRFAGEAGPAPGDVDLLVIGTPDRDDVYDAARRAAQRLGVEVNTTIRTARQWRGATDAFSRQVKAGPLLAVIREEQARR